MSANPSARFARELVANLAAKGVREFVLCPGSRSGPIAHALAEAASANPPLGAPQVELHVRIDERSAAFLALGLARAHVVSGDPRPVAVVTTSGTAVGNLFPAVMEAHHAGLPLVLLTADRPGELRGVGANQTTDQVGIFGTFARWSADAAAPTDDEAPGRAARLAIEAVAVAMGAPKRNDSACVMGPVHLDLEFRSPLHADGGVWPQVGEVQTPRSGTAMAPPIEDEPPQLPGVERGVVIAGDGASDGARLIAEAHGWPLLAEPTSGARAGSAAIDAYPDLLASERGRALTERVHQVVVVGRPTLSRPITSLIDGAAALYVAAHGARWREAPRHAQCIVHEVPAAWMVRGDGPLNGSRSAWLGEWHAAAKAGTTRPDQWSAEQVAVEYVASLNPADVAVLGSSRAIRLVDRFAPVWAPGEAPNLVANRGLSGIDGTISTAVGVALATDVPVSALMGDVTFLHDVGGLMIGPLERRPNLRIVVVNDGGGTIFARMEHGADAPERVERVFTTPHGVDLGSICAAYGVGHAAVSDVRALRAALAQPVIGLHVVEAVVS